MPFPNRVGEGSISFDSVTTLVGANDSGKSALLNFIREALAGSGESLEHREYTVFLKCRNTEERDRLVAEAAADLFEFPDKASKKIVRTGPTAVETPEHPGLMPRKTNRRRISSSYFVTPEYESLARSNNFPKDLRSQIWGLGVWRGASLDRINLKVSGNVADSYAQACCDSTEGHVPSDGVFMEAMRESQVFAFRPDGDRWNVYWCLCEDLLTDEIAEDLLRLGHVLLGGNAIEAPSDLTARGAPLIVAPVGAITTPSFPEVISLPTDTETLEERLSEAIDSLQLIRRGAKEEALPSEESEWDTNELESFRDSWWIDDGGPSKGYEPNPWMKIHSSGMETISEVAERINSYLLPTFPYRVGFEVFLSYSDGVVLSMFLESKGSSVHRFEFQNLAEGFRPWLQFALLRTLVECREYVNLNSRIRELDSEPSNWQGSPPDSIAQFYFGPLDHALSHEARVAVTETLDEQRQQDESPDSVLPRIGPDSPSLLVVIDEPERQLHPALQRQVANWLHDAVQEQTEIQLLTATHSLPFMRMGRNQSIVRVQRSGDATATFPIAVKNSEAIVPVLADLGMDFGELLSLTRVILWVEGEHDKAVLEELFGERLWLHGITCVPMHSASKSKGLTSVGALFAELLRSTKARSAVWFDGIRDSVRDQLMRSPDAALEIGRRIATERKEGSGGSPEESDACALVAAAGKAGQQLLVYSHPKDDVWNLLDGDTIESYARSMNLEYNHAEVMAEWDELVKSKKRRKSELKWSFLKEEKGLDPSADTIRAIARKMSEDGVPPHPELEAIVWECERLSLESTP